MPRKTSETEPSPPSIKYIYKYEVHEELEINLPDDITSLKWSERILNKIGKTGKKVVQIFRLDDTEILDADGRTSLKKLRYAFLIEVAA